MIIEGIAQVLLVHSEMLEGITRNHKVHSEMSEGTTRNRKVHSEMSEGIIRFSLVQKITEIPKNIFIISAWIADNVCIIIYRKCNIPNVYSMRNMCIFAIKF